MESKSLEFNPQDVEDVINFFKENKNFDSMPVSSKVIVFDVDIRVKDAFTVAAENDILFASLWDNKKGELVGMLTVTDLIAILLHYHDETSIIKDLIAKESVRKWRDISKRERKSTLISASPEDSLWDSILLLKSNNIHRLPVITKEGTILHITTYSHLLGYLCSNYSFASSLFDMSIKDLNIGTFENIITAKETDTVYHTIQLFKNNRVTAVPIVDDDESVIDVYSRYDIVYMVREGDYALNCTLKQALETRPKIPVFTCKVTESLGKVMRHLSRTRIHRLVCVDDDMRIVGIISIADIFDWMIQRYEEFKNSTKSQK